MTTALRIEESTATHVVIQMWINGALCSGIDGLSIRLGDLTEFVMLVNPERVAINPENVSPDIIRRLEAAIDKKLHNGVIQLYS